METFKQRIKSQLFKCSKSQPNKALFNKVPINMHTI